MMSRPGGTSSPLSPKSPLDTSTSRIPRFSPLSSPSPLRRSGSQRVHKTSTDHFPSIAENSNGSSHHTPPIRRSNSSLSLTPLRSRRNCRRSGGGGNVVDECSDNDSVRSFGSTASCCDHPHFALNGTTWSARSRSYLVHCPGSLLQEPAEYRTPTQRAALELRNTQSQLRQAAKEIEEKDRQIVHLTQELVELRLQYKASPIAAVPPESSPSHEPDAVDSLEIETGATDGATTTTTTKTNGVSQQQQSSSETKREEPVEATIVVASSSSLVDSGHFDASSSIASSTTAQSKDINASPSHQLVAVGDSPQHRRLYLEEIQELKQNHNDRVEALLYQLSEMSTRYFEAKPRLDAAEARCKELEKEAEELRAKLEQHKILLAEQEERNKQMYLKMYAKGQEAARMEQADQITTHDPNNPATITVADLLKKLSITEAELENTRAQAQQEHSSCAADLLALASRCQSLLTVEEAVSLWVLGTRKALYRRLVDSKNQEAQDPEITLQFLKSAVYYFLTDRENLHGHLKAIESILGFTDAEKLNIDKVYGSARK